MGLFKPRGREAGAGERPAAGQFEDDSRYKEEGESENKPEVPEKGSGEEPEKEPTE